MLGLIPANNALVDTEISLAAELGCRSCGKRQSPSAFVSVHGQLEEGIRKGGLSEYDLIIIDCSPAFSVLTRTAVIASDHVLVPARPDYLSVYGLAAFSHRLREIVSTYNSKLVAAGGRKNDPGRATADVLGVVFTMAGVHRDAPIQSSRDPMSRVHALELHVFDSVIRENKTAFTEAVQKLRPVVLMDLKRKGPGRELRDLADEFVAKLWGGKRG